MAEAGDVPREVVGKSASEDNSFSAVGYSPPSNNLLRGIVIGLNSHVTSKLKCSGPTGRAEAKESQHRRDGNPENA